MSLEVRETVDNSNRICNPHSSITEIERDALAAPKLIFVLHLYNRDKVGTPIACKCNFQKNFLSVGKILGVITCSKNTETCFKVCK